MARSPRISTAAVLIAVILLGCSQEERPVADAVTEARFVPVQPDFFGAFGAQPNAWADYDLDGDLDLFVGFRPRANRLYRNDEGRFVEVAADVGLADVPDTRAAAWGDFDLDGDPDLFVGLDQVEGEGNRLYRNDATSEGRRFVDVAPDLGIDDSGVSRQPAFVDFDGDGDLDLFVAFRDQPNRLYRNDGDGFTDVTEPSGVGDPRRTVGAAWFDMDGDGDLDLFTANQNGDEDGVFENQGDGTFRDVAGALGMSQPGRTEEQGSVGVAVADFDNDGDLDLFVPSYGPDVLWRNQGDGTFVNVAGGTPLASDHHSVAAAWGDFDNDGWVDLYVDRYLNSEPETPDALFRNNQGTFEEVTPGIMLEKGATHGVAWADFDGDGDLDLALANNSDPDGTHPLYRNELTAARAERSIQLVVLDGEGRAVRAGAHVLMEEEGPDGSVGPWVSARMVETGSGYASQGSMPVHFGIPEGVDRVRLTVTWFEDGGLRSETVTGIDWRAHRGSWLQVRTPAS